MIGTKEVAGRTREIAFDTLIAIAKRADEAGQGVINGARVMELVMGSLAGATPFMMVRVAAFIRSPVY